MTDSPEDVVRAFFAGMHGRTIEDFKDNYRRHMAPDVVWESVGFPRHEGLEACLDYLDTLLRETGMVRCAIELEHLACDGDVVLTERVDTMLRDDGSEIMRFRLMGALEVRDGRIVRYTDYLDTLGTARRLGRL